MKHTHKGIALAFAACALVVHAPALRAGDPPPSPGGAPSADDQAKLEARALMKEGVRLLGTGDNAGALSLFRSAYAKFPSAKILLNIGSTLKTMGRSAEAANTYQRFLDAPDTDASKHAEVNAVLAQLDAQLGRLAITVDVADAELQVDGDWQPAAAAKLVRVAPGAYEVHARRHGLPDTTAKGEVVAGATATVVITLTPAPPKPAPEAPPKPAPIPAPVPAPLPGAAIGATTAPAEPATWGALADVIVDGKGRGAAGRVGALFDVGDRVELEAAALLGPTIGAYAGAVGYVTGGTLRVRASAGVPIFFSSGARIGVRGGAGLEWRASANLALVGELGVEHYFNAERDIDATAFTPIVGVTGRL